MTRHAFAFLMVGLMAPAAVAQDATQAETPTLHVFGRSGLEVTLPAGWDGPAVADEGLLPAYAIYAFPNRADGPLQGSVLRVERIVGLNPLEREKWRTGQTAYGWHGSQPTGSAEVPIPGARGVAVQRPAPASWPGVSAFVQTGSSTYWTVHIEAPPAVWAAEQAVLVGILRSLTLPEAGDAPRAPTP